MVEDEFLGFAIESRGDDREARMKFREDLAAGAARADRDICFVSPKLRFSTLQPVKTVPSLHSMAAPTGKFE